MQDPVNIMNVIAYPNPNGDRTIRFIDASYHTLFTIPDGGNIVLTLFDGTTETHPCLYIDDTHAKIGSQVYHICQFAEVMESNGCTYAPEGGTADTYEIYQIEDAGVDYCFRGYEKVKDHILLSDYRRVYAGMLGRDVDLEELYIKHNRDGRPFGRRMRSVSVSDIFIFRRNGEKHAYYTDSVGFAEADEILTKTE